MKRYDLINKIISENSFKRYLEIGVCHPHECFDKINCDNKDSVDPGYESEQNLVKYKMTSDEFFNLLKISPMPKYDIIFIDGLHLSWQVKLDIENSLKHLNDDGYIILHDCNPPTLFHARENYEVDGQLFDWNGTVWKALYDVRSHRKDLYCCTVNTDWGLGIIRKNLKNDTELIPHENYFYDYDIMVKNRNRDLGLIEIDEIDNWIKNTNEKVY